MAKRIIKLDGDPAQTDYVCSEAITPGMLVCPFMNSSVKSVKIQTGVGVKVAPIFMLENRFGGGEVEDASTLGEVVTTATFGVGMRVAGIIKDGENIAFGDLLVSAGGGQLKKHTPATATTISTAGLVEGDVVLSAQEYIVGVARDSIDLSDTGFAIADRRLAIEIV